MAVHCVHIHKCVCERVLKFWEINIGIGIREVNFEAYGQLSEMVT